MLSCMRFLIVLTTPENRIAHEPVPCLPAQLTFTRLSPAANSGTSRWRDVRDLQVLSRGIPNSRETAAATLPVHPDSLPARSPQGSIAPSLSELLGSGTIRSATPSMLEPRPLQSTHMP